MKFSELAASLYQLEKTPSRLMMTQMLSQIFLKSAPEEIDKVCYLSLGQLAPTYTGVELSMAEKMMIRAIAAAFGISGEEITKEYKKSGDLGETASKLKTKTENLNLSVTDIHTQLTAIARESGTGSQERKINMMVKLLHGIDSLSAKYIVRISLKKLRLGFSDMTVLDALSWSKTGDKSLRKILENAFNVLADIGKIARIFRKEGIEEIQKIKSEIGVPIMPAKAERLGTSLEILEKMGGECAIEPKYDGFRTQIHINKRREFTSRETNSLHLFEENKQFYVRIFSRNLENMTHMFPDIVRAAQSLPVNSAILDGEAIAYDPKTGDFLPFQETVQRKRKHDVTEKSQSLPLKVFCFDILSLNGESLLQMQFSRRRELLEKIFSKREKEEILLTEQKIVTKEADFDSFFKTVVNEGLEGLIAKKLDAVYAAGARNFNWVKYKAGMKSELADTIDCIVMGYYKGLGKRNEFGIGAFLVGVPDSDNILTVSKIGTGLTDEQWREMYKRIDKIKVSQKPEEYQVNKNLYPDVWCQPKLVVEIEADTITQSPIHTAGLALRFPRLKHFRDDKEIREATSLEELKELRAKNYV